MRVTLDQSGGKKSLEGSHLLVAAGRVPNTKDIGLELAGVELTHNGYVKVNERLETTAPGVRAVGERLQAVRNSRISARMTSEWCAPTYLVGIT